MQLLANSVVDFQFTSKFFCQNIFCVFFTEFLRKMSFSSDEVNFLVYRYLQVKQYYLIVPVGRSRMILILSKKF
jgi:hypothetical protein